MRQGRIAGVVDRAEATQEKLLELALPSGERADGNRIEARKAS
jgi:hypothetical protein